MKDTVHNVENLEKTVLLGNGRCFNVKEVLEVWQKSVENNKQVGKDTKKDLELLWYTE